MYYTIYIGSKSAALRTLLGLEEEDEEEEREADDDDGDAEVKRANVPPDTLFVPTCKTALRPARKSAAENEGRETGETYQLDDGLWVWVDEAHDRWCMSRRALALIVTLCYILN